MTSVMLGQTVPDFQLPATGGKTIKLTDFLGKKVVLYFYPKDNTPGCTQEGCAFRDRYPEFDEHNAAVLGVSRDSIKIHEGFKAKQQFPFDLLADREETLCQLFDVIKLKNMYGKQVRGIERSTFLIDEQGILIYEWRKVQVKTHIQQVLDKLAELG